MPFSKFWASNKPCNAPAASVYTPPKEGKAVPAED